MTGKVYLVGAGPGDSKLITLRAVELLKKSDVVLYDRLVSKKIISMIPKKAIKVYVGRAVGDYTTHQITTNDLMVKYAKSNGAEMTLSVVVFSVDGTKSIQVKKTGDKNDPKLLGKLAGQELSKKGVNDLALNWREKVEEWNKT